MIPSRLMNGHDDESRASTHATATSLDPVDPERLSHDNASRQFHNTLLELPSASQTPIRYSVTSFNENLDRIDGINADEESPHQNQGDLNHPPSDSGEYNPGPEGPTRNSVPAPDERTNHRSSEPLPVAPPLLQPTLDPHGQPNSPPLTTSNRLPPTTDWPQNPPVEQAVPQPTPLSTTLSPVHASHPTPNQPSSPTGDPITRRNPDRHHRRFIRWVKKKFRRQSPWSAGSPHSITEAERALNRVDSQGLSSTMGRP